jgi:hypothetical protein
VWLPQRVVGVCYEKSSGLRNWWTRTRMMRMIGSLNLEERRRAF